MWGDIKCMYCGDENVLWPRCDDTIICDDCLEKENEEKTC